MLIVIRDGAAGVIGLAFCFDVAVACLNGASKTGVQLLNGASVTGVQGYLICSLGIDAFDDVDFAVGRPCRALAQHPESGPGTTGAGGHVS